MSLYSLDTRYNANNPIYAPLPISVSSLTVSSLTANSLTANSLTANRITAVSTLSGFFEGSYGEISNWYVDEKLYVNFQELTADSDQLFLNGVPVATTANLSSIQNWSYFAQVSTLDGNNQSTIGLSYLEASTIGTKNLTASNIFTQNLMAFNIVNFTSTVVEVYESTIQSDVKLANISTANIKNAFISTGSVSTLNSINASFSNLSAGTASINTLTGGSASFSNFTASSITVSSIVSPPAASATFSSITVVSNTNTGSLTVGCNNTTTFAAAPTFSDGANFNGTRPNFNSGINTASANNFNNCNLDNVGKITANTVFIGSSNYVDIQTSSFTAILNNRGADVGGNSVIDLKSQFGAATRINLTADASSSLAPTPTQIITLTANGATSLTQNAVGGRVSIVANAGSGVGCNILGFGQIDLTAYSSLPFAGVIKESAGSILAYSGLTVPAVGVFGGSFYSALTTLSLTCGVTPVTTSFPGVVYLRGDNGTKVVNGFDVDNITLSSINGAAYVPGGGGGGTVSTFTNLQTSSFTVSSINGSAYPPPGGWVSTATTLLDMNGNPITDLTGTLLLTVGSTNYTSYSQTSTSIDLLQAGGAGYVRRNVAGNIIDTAVGNIQTTATSTINTVPHTVFTGGIRVSSINGASFPTAGSTISTFTTLTTSAFFVSSINGATLISNLTMGLNDIIFDGGKSVSCESNQIYMAGNGTDYVSMYNGGASVQIANDQNIYLTGNASSIGGVNTVNFQNTNINMTNGDIILNNNTITAVSSISAGGELSITANTNILTTAASTINTVPNTIFTGQIFTNNGTTGLAWGSAAPYSIGIDGPFLFGFTQGALGTTSNANDISLAWDAAEVNIYKTLDMEDNFILNVSTITASGELSISANNDILTSAVSTINTVQNTYFTGGISKRLDGVGILQPVIQYGQVSSSGGSGTVIVSTPYAYSAVNSYLPFACMADAPAAEIYVSTLTEQAFEIGWQNGGGGNQLFNWNTLGN